MSCRQCRLYNKLLHVLILFKLVCHQALFYKIAFLYFWSKPFIFSKNAGLSYNEVWNFTKKRTPA